MKYDVIVIGGGAAGLTAALSASGQGARVLVLEGANRVGRKILASGNGRCNLANMGPRRYPGGGDFAQAVFKKCSVRQVLDFFHGLGLVTVEEDEGRVYPGCGQAAAVLEVLRGEMDRRGIEVICENPVQRIQIVPWGLRVQAKQGAYDAPAVIAACGGMAGGKLGHDGGAYRLLTDLGHTLIPPKPSLCPLVAEKSAVKGLSGLRLPAILTLCRKRDGLRGRTPDQPLCPPQQGEALFTDYGVSGVCAMELARAAEEAHEKNGAWPVLYIDFSPMLGLCPRRYGELDPGAEDPLRHLPAVQAFLRQRAHKLPSDALLQGMVPRLLAERLKGRSLSELAWDLAAFPVPLAGVRGMEYAQVTAGGIHCAEFDPQTLHSLLTPGLYAAGELLNVDGACGGFNLQFAFASGILAGKAAAVKA
ncbi:MAG: aminoacetone oxidase family FAD-binding enzyme [Clostridia bacterium]|nr:aminoacetone oxidase family FAD-binding enzyme [Clostridia bacterium]